MEALRTIVELMSLAKNEKVRLDDTTTLLALAGMRPVEGFKEEKLQASSNGRRRSKACS